MLLAITACSDPAATCPNRKILVLPYEGPAVTANEFVCEGEPAGGLWCDRPPIHVRRVDEHDCGGGAQVTFQDTFVGLERIRIHLEGSLPEVIVRVQSEGACDDDGCELQTRDPVSGSISVEEFDRAADGRIAGSIYVQFGSASMTASFDTTRPPWEPGDATP